MRTLILIGCACLLVPCMFAQNWKQVHKEGRRKVGEGDGAGLQSPSTKSGERLRPFPTNRMMNSRIANLDLTGLAERHDVLLVTYAGEKNLPDHHRLPPAFRHQVLEIMVG